ncbi:MAG: hypothetical protein Ta2G_18280 [Termitinemataceae bacterium]|nr:MAG: hypothetical protein Ta2G_18280 [Termitinemataceae bacterium]
MQTYEFSTAVENHGIIHIPEEYLKDISSTVKVIIFTKDEESQPKRKTFKAMKMHTKGFKFNREEANER